MIETYKRGIIMDLINVSLVSLSMSVDACCVNAANAISDNEIKKRKLVLAAFLFGLFQGIMPLLGYLIGSSFKNYVEKYIPWIAFGLLFLLGIKSLIEGIKELKNKNEVEKNRKLTIPALLVEALATSIDAFCIGFVYMDESLENALIIFSIIALVTFVLSLLSGFFGKVIGKKLEKYAPFISSVIFIAIGLKILIESFI